MQQNATSSNGILLDYHYVVAEGEQDAIAL